ncbi:hypothetical protein LTR50_004158 [Elasticomyces elasticus]|nr:hypothetical protein LTR50_004158 [Elasticomyces elasticus]
MAENKDQTFTFDEMAVICSAVLDLNGSIAPYYGALSAADGTRTPGAYQHRMRKVLARAKELKAGRDSGQDVTAASPKTPKASGTKKGVAGDASAEKKRGAAKSGGRSAKRSKKHITNDDDDDENSESGVKIEHDEKAVNVKAEPDGEEAD